MGAGLAPVVFRPGGMLGRGGGRAADSGGKYRETKGLMAYSGCMSTRFRVEHLQENAQGFKDATNLPIEEVANKVVNLLGSTMAASIVGISDRKQPQRWAQGLNHPKPESETILRFTLRIILMFEEAKIDPKIIRVWFLGSNPDLGEATPITYIREGVRDQVANAARIFVAL